MNDKNLYPIQKKIFTIKNEIEMKKETRRTVVAREWHTQEISSW
jgi:hypothetical protein